MLLLLHDVLLELLRRVLARVKVGMGKCWVRLCVHGSEHHLLLLLVMVVRLGLVLGCRCDRLRRFLPDSYTLLAMLTIRRIASHIDIYL